MQQLEDGDIISWIGPVAAAVRLLEALFLRAQFDPEPVYATLTAVAAGEVDSFRNLEPASMIDETKPLQQMPWERKVTDGLGTRHQAIEHSYDMQPETPVETN